MTRDRLVATTIRTAPKISPKKVDNFRPRFNLTLNPGEMRTTDPDEYFQLLVATGLALTSTMTVDQIVSDASQTAIHELQHASAATALGVDEYYFGIQLFKVRGDRRRRMYLDAYLIHRDNGLTILEDAAIAGHPFYPSTGDIQKINALGFSSITALGQVIADHNTHSDRQIPLPLSYVPTL